MQGTHLHWKTVVLLLGFLHVVCTGECPKNNAVSIFISNNIGVYIYIKKIPYDKCHYRKFTTILSI